MDGAATTPDRIVKFGFALRETKAPSAIELDEPGVRDKARRQLPWAMESTMKTVEAAGDGTWTRR